MRMAISFMSSCLVFPAIFADWVPNEMKYFSAWITDVTYNSTNDSIVVRHNPEAARYAYVRVGGESLTNVTRVQPGANLLLNRGRAVYLTEHERIGCHLVFTNDVFELDGVALPSEFKNSDWQLIISGTFVSGVSRNSLDKYVFVVNAKGQAIDIRTGKRFVFGIPFHSSKGVSYRFDRSMENIQKLYLEEGVLIHERALKETRVKDALNHVRVGVTNAVSFIWEFGGLGNISKKDRDYLLKRDSVCPKPFCGFESSRTTNRCVAFCANENGVSRIVAVAKVCGQGHRIWRYGEDGVPTLLYTWNCTSCEKVFCGYDGGKMLKSFCFVRNNKIVDFRTVKNGALKKSTDLQGAKSFVSAVEGAFCEFIDLNPAVWPK